MNSQLTTESEIAAAALALGAASVTGFSERERQLASVTPPPSPKLVAALRSAIRSGEDPLGVAFCTVRTAETRRANGATYTPANIVNAMFSWAVETPAPQRVVDPGVGSGRFLCTAGTHFGNAELVGMDVDPLATLMARANLASLGFAGRSRIDLADYRSAVPLTRGRTLFVGNPPYVRHHLIPAEWKTWLVDKAAQYGLKASQLAGLHVYFFLATVLQARPGDHGVFVTAAEWLDVNYGKLLRDLFLGPLGGQGIVVVEPTAMPFPDAATTAAITTFAIGSKPTSVKLRRVKRVKDLVQLDGGKPVRRERLEAETRWSRLTHTGRTCPDGFVELGELCRVHRGTVTGANKVFVAGSDAADVPDRFKFRSITRARELMSAGRVLSDVSNLKHVVDLPDDLDLLEQSELAGVQSFLEKARAKGADKGYVARNRRAWWSVGLREPAPILATYMARRPPSFVRNIAGARHINIAHGLYPREQLSDNQLLRLVDYLATGISVLDGRTYAGGLTKFEPGEMERLYVPSPQLLAAARP